MKLSLILCNSGTSPKGYDTSPDSLERLAEVMGISNFATVKVPEQGLILRYLYAHLTVGGSTRELADYCGITIYKVRHLLLPLEKNGQVNREKIHKHHQWFLSKNFTEIEEDSIKGNFSLQ